MSLELRNWLGVFIVLLGLVALPQLGRAQPVGRIELPEPASVQSGQTVIRGWVCTATVVTLSLDGGTPVVAPYRILRGDTATQEACGVGDADNGFVYLINGNDFPGTHTLAAYADGELFDQVVFSFTSLGLGQFPTGLSGQFPITDFPLLGQTVEIEWRTAAQNFVLRGGGGSGGNEQQSATGRLEEPEASKVHSGQDLIRGWVCTAGVVTLSLDFGTPIEAPYRILRGDTATQEACGVGDADNGFVYLVNWNDVVPGAHTLRAYADGVLFASVEFHVTSLGLGQFPLGLDKEATLLDFPQAGTDVHVRWQESRQNFSLQGVLAPGQSANQCGSQSAPLQDGNGTTGSVTVTNPCTAPGDTVEVELGLQGPSQSASMAQRQAQAVGTSLRVCVTDIVIEQGGQQFTSDAFRWVDGQGTEITCLEVAPGQTLPGLLVVKPGVALNFNEPFQIKYRQIAVMTFSEVAPPRLTVTKSGEGDGTVTSDPAGIGCGLDCAESYSLGTVVQLGATPAEGSTFTGWAGDCSGTALTTSVTMDTNRTCTATFIKDTAKPVLTVTVQGSGSGSVTSTPVGISCPGNCSASYNSGTPVTLTASAAEDSTFTGWGGDCNATGSVTMDADHTCTAIFTTDTPQPVVLTVTVGGSGSGSVSSTPAGIGCPGDCSEPYPPGTVVTLTATPAEGSTFTGWSSDCSGTDSTTSVTMTAARSCTATFNLIPEPVLTVTLAGSGSGSVTSTPAGIGCPGDCSEPYRPGTVVRLTAAPDSGWSFISWGGDCSGTAPTTSVTMDADHTCTATFDAIIGTQGSARRVTIRGQE